MKSEFTRKFKAESSLWGSSWIRKNLYSEAAGEGMGGKAAKGKNLPLGLEAMAFTVRREPIHALDASPIGSPLYKCWLLLMELNS